MKFIGVNDSQLLQVGHCQESLMVLYPQFLHKYLNLFIDF